MTGSAASGWSLFLAAVLIAAIPVLHAQAPGNFGSEPDKSMASAHDSFAKGEMNKAAEHIQAAAAYVRKEGDSVARDARQGMIKASDELAKLGREVKKGTVKTGDELKKIFAQVDQARADAWHATAAQAQKSGKDATAALKNAGAGLEGAAKWSGAQLQGGAQASVEGLKKAGKVGSEDLAKFFKGIGDGIADLGRKLSP
jgi:urease accessory protein UreF